LGALNAGAEFGAREGSMGEQPTCGKGLAANAVLPAKLGELTSAVGDILAAHIPSLDLTDERSRQEREVYHRLAEDHRRAGLQLEAIAQRMTASRDLPMGRHEEAAMASPAALQSFRRFVQSEQELLATLQGRLKQDQQMLTAMEAGR
jgi:hypothetical protein